MKTRLLSRPLPPPPPYYFKIKNPTLRYFWQIKKSTGQSFRLECKFGRITGWWLFLFFAVLHLLQTQRTGIKHLVVGVPVAHEAWKVHNLTLNTVKSNKCWTANIHNLKELQISLSIYLVVLLNGRGYAISCISTGEEDLWDTERTSPIWM